MSISAIYRARRAAAAAQKDAAVEPRGNSSAAGGRNESDDVVLSAMDACIPRRLITPARLAWAGLTVALAGGVTFAYATYGFTRTLTVGAERVTVAKAGYGTFREYIPLTGNIVPRATVYLDSVEGGQVTDVIAEAGDMVEAGDVLLQLKNTNLQLQVLSAEAQLAEQLDDLASNSLALEQNRLRHRRETIGLDHEIGRIARELARRGPLAGSGAPRKEVAELEADLAYYRSLRAVEDEARALDERLQTAQVAQLRNALETMNRNLDIARGRLGNLAVSAPISGQLTFLDVALGESVGAGERIGQIDEIDAFKVQAFVDEFYLPRLVPGQRAAVEIARGPYVLEIAKIYPEIRGRQFQVDFAFVGKAPAHLRRGQTVRMQLEIGAPADTLVLANGPFYEDTGGRWVFVVAEAGGFALRRNVRFGRRNPDNIEVVEGLAEGERVITSSYRAFLDFDRIRLSGEESS